jgi:hypothetical protein
MKKKPKTPAEKAWETIRRKIAANGGWREPRTNKEFAVWLMARWQSQWTGEKVPNFQNLRIRR